MFVLPNPGRVVFATLFLSLVYLVSLRAAPPDESTSSVAAAIASTGTSSQGLEITVEIPRLEVSEYHRPYVALWIEDELREARVHLAVWYQLQANKEGAGTKWLPDLRQWWRRGGRSLELPVDGLSGATRPVGKHDLKIDASKLNGLMEGQYSLVVEAAREVGGREVVRIPFEWPVRSAKSLAVRGETELGEIVLNLKP